MIQTLSTTVVLLTASNLFMTFAWYAHLKTLNHRPWIIAALGAVFFMFRTRFVGG